MDTLELEEARRRRRVPGIPHRGTSETAEAPACTFCLGRQARDDGAGFHATGQDGFRATGFDGFEAQRRSSQPCGNVPQDCAVPAHGRKADRLRLQPIRQGVGMNALWRRWQRAASSCRAP